MAQSSRSAADARGHRLNVRAPSRDSLRTPFFLDHTQNLKKTVKYTCYQRLDKPRPLHMKVTTIGRMSAPLLDLYNQASDLAERVPSVTRCSDFTLSRRMA